MYSQLVPLSVQRLGNRLESSSDLQLVSCLVARVLTSRPRWNFCHPSIRRTAVGQLQGQPPLCSCPPASESKEASDGSPESPMPVPLNVCVQGHVRGQLTRLSSSKPFRQQLEPRRPSAEGKLRFARHLRRVKEKDHDRPTQNLLSDGPDGSSGRLLRQSVRCPCIE